VDAPTRINTHQMEGIGIKCSHVWTVPAWSIPATPMLHEKRRKESELPDDKPLRPLVRLSILEDPIGWLATVQTLASCRLGKHLLTGDSGRAGVAR
jgi:hypothetical protein